jgi:hypothetical protein
MRKGYILLRIVVLVAIIGLLITACKVEYPPKPSSVATLKVINNYHNPITRVQVGGMILSSYPNPNMVAAPVFDRIGLNITVSESFSFNMSSYKTYYSSSESYYDEGFVTVGLQGIPINLYADGLYGYQFSNGCAFIRSVNFVTDKTTTITLNSNGTITVINPLPFSY